MEHLIFKLLFVFVAALAVVSAYDAQKSFDDPELKEEKPEEGDDRKESLFKQFIEKYNKKYR